jgi:hypothetical protein
MSVEVETTRQGIRYADGTYDWNAGAAWGDLADAGTQEAFCANYEMRMRSLGAEPRPIEFVQQDVVTTYGEVSILVPMSPTEEGIDDGSVTDATPDSA